MPSLVSSSKRSRRGAIAIMSAILVVALLAMVAFALDIGFLAQSRTELQRTADSAALASAWDFFDESALHSDVSANSVFTNVRGRAAQYAGLNPVGGAAPLVDQNPTNHADGEVVIGYLSDLSNANQSMTFTNPADFNAVQVRVRRNANQNGSVPLFFARIFGYNSMDMEATATAAVLKDIRGFQVPSDGSNLPILPIGVNIDIWNDLVANSGPDNYTWNTNTQHVNGGADNVAEASIYPTSTGASGNSGTVNIGTSNNSASNLRDQIRNGITASEMNYHGGKLDLGTNGQLTMSGDPGLSASIESALGDIVGEARIVPIFDGVTGEGSGASFTIVKWGGVRIMSVNLNGGSKHLIIQPAYVLVDGAIAGSSGGGSNSNFIHAPVRLVR